MELPGSNTLSITILEAVILEKYPAYLRALIRRVIAIMWNQYLLIFNLEIYCKRPSSNAVANAKVISCVF